MKKLTFFAFMLMLAFSFNSCDLLNPEEEEEDDEVIVNQDITTPTTWLSSKTYIVENGIYVDGTTFTIEPGTVIKFKAGTFIAFGHNDNVTLTANGTAEKPIIFTTYASSPAAGSWEGVWIYSNTLTNSSMTYCEVLYAGQNDYPAVSAYEKITMNNCKIKNTKKVGIYSEFGFVSFTGNTIEDCGTHAIEIESVGVQTLGANNAITCGSNFGILVHSGELEGATATWTEQTVPYIIDGGIYVDGTFTIQPGTVIKFTAYGWIEFGYNETTTLNVVGTAENPITFTSAAASPAAGAWVGLFFRSNVTSNSLMKYCIVEYAGKDYENANITLYDVNGLTIEECIIRHSSGWGIYSYYSTWNNTNNTFTNNPSGEINVIE